MKQLTIIKTCFKSKIDKIVESTNFVLNKNFKPLLDLNFNDFSIRFIFTKLRISYHGFEKENDRYIKIPREC